MDILKILEKINIVVINPCFHRSKTFVFKIASSQAPFMSPSKNSIIQNALFHTTSLKSVTCKKSRGMKSVSFLA